MQRPQLGHRRLAHVVHAQHRMRVAHRQHGHLHLPGFGQIQRPQFKATLAPRLQAAGVERHAGQVEHRLVHVHRHPAVGLQVQLQAVVDGVDSDGGLGGQALVVHEAHEAARAVAAMLDLVAGVVEDAVAEVGMPGAARRLDDQDLVGAHAEAAVAQVAQLLPRELQRGARGIEHDEVVARALHLGELHLHATIIRPGGRTARLRPPAES
jgi:hypothetical protein